ncbi:hypothetical protein BV25DRAFT_1988564 [Artomyces pyxidatus]|uniref:Uncharacterized protein n=1 Tax=Artomyces pyxidatus TaxID=48021 RepID=A0ACB8TD98_9AGAM|nr:hypothetical protein BV25DRAFT_1988564 [Artomyces pyxidatus]
MQDSARSRTTARTEKLSEAVGKSSSSRTRVSPNDIDRYAALQRKLEMLERVHADGKKSYQSDLDRLKGELVKAQKANTEQAERIDKIKKQNDTLDARIQDLKRANLSDQTEIKDLRVKLRISEQERLQLSAKQVETGDAKKALHNLEARRREESRERDRQLADLQRSLAVERKRREAAEGRLQDLDGTVNKEAQESRASLERLQILLKDAQEEKGRVQHTLETERAEAKDREEERVAQLEALRVLLGRAAEQYGRLASETVPRATHDRLKGDHASSQIRIFRLERKLANCEGQVSQLASLIRQTKDANEFLLDCLRDADEDWSRHISAWQDVTSHMRRLTPSQDSLVEDLYSAREDLLQVDLQSEALHGSTLQLSVYFQRYIKRDLLLAMDATTKDLADERAQVERRNLELEALKESRDVAVNDIQALRVDIGACQRELVETKASLEDAVDREATLARRLADGESRLREQAASHLQALEREKETIQRLTSSVQKSRMAEEALRADIDQLTNELTDAERYQEAYYGLVDQVGALAARNDLAEGEAERLSKFNAEILSHNNPAQRIMYLDRIRRELADTKQALLVVTRERDAAAAHGEELRNELAMYVAVPTDLKPRTNITRVARIPLATQSLNVAGPRTDVVDFDPLKPASLSGEMTLDDIM